MTTYRIDIHNELAPPGDCGEEWQEIPRVFNHTAELLLTAEAVLEHHDVIRIRRVDHNRLEVI